MIDYYIESLSKQIKEAKETNNLEREKTLKAFSRMLSMAYNIYQIARDNRKSDEIHKFICFVAQISYRCITRCIEERKVDLKRLEFYAQYFAYDYALWGGGGIFSPKRIDFLSLGKLDFENEKDDENLFIPVPITRTEEWYNYLRTVNS